MKTYHYYKSFHAIIAVIYLKTFKIYECQLNILDSFGPNLNYLCLSIFTSIVMQGWLHIGMKVKCQLDNYMFQVDDLCRLGIDVCYFHSKKHFKLQKIWNLILTENIHISCCEWIYYYLCKVDVFQLILWQIPEAVILKYSLKKLSSKVLEIIWENFLNEGWRTFLRKIKLHRGCLIWRCEIFP